MRTVVAWILALLAPALCFAQSGVTLPAGSSTLKALHFKDYPALGIYESSAGSMYVGGTSGGLTFTDTAVTGGAFTGSTLTSPSLTTPTITTPTISGAITFSSSTTLTPSATALTVGTGYYLVADNLAVPMVADAALQYGTVVMIDAGTANRFDASSSAGTASIGVVGGTGATVQASTYPVVLRGFGNCWPDEDGAWTLAHYAVISAATAGKCADSATISTIGKNIGRVLAASPVTNTIDPTGCGGGGCINTTSGVITLAADVAAQGWAPGDPVVYYNSGGATPTGLTDGGVYWLLTVATTNVTISATKGGTAVVPTTQGNDATQYLQKLPQIVVQLQ